VGGHIVMMKEPVVVCAIFALGDCGLFHCDNCCFVSRS
jgi:hypothetical protein